MKIIVAFIIGAVVGVGSLQIPAVQQKIGQSLGSQMLIEVESPLGFDETLAKIEEEVIS